MSTREIKLKQLKGITFSAKGDSNHWVMMDGPAEFGGSNSASRPKELLLMALAGCTASDVIPILEKKRVKLNGFEIDVRGTEREEHPKVFTNIHVEYKFFGDDINPKDVEHAIELSTSKYCSVSAMLKSSVSITHSYKINP